LRTRRKRRKSGDIINIGRGDGRKTMMTGNGGNIGIDDGTRRGDGRKVRSGNVIHIVGNEIEMMERGGTGIEKKGTGGTETGIANENVIKIEITRETGMLDEEIQSPTPDTVLPATTPPADNTEKKKEIEITTIDNGTRPIPSNILLP
jgi:hypothetical protein